MTKIALLACLIVPSAAAIAQAQPAAADAPGAAPAPAHDVSTLSGQLVRVGDQNQYRYSYRPWNVSLNPLGAVLGFYGVSGSYAFHPNFAVRADVNYYNPVGSGDGSGFELGVGVPIYFRKAYSGMFLEPGAIYRRLDGGGEGDGDGSSTHAGPQVMLGYHWSWDSGLNVALAFGLGRNLASGDEADVFPNGYLRVGYAF